MGIFKFNVNELFTQDHNLEILASSFFARGPQAQNHAEQPVSQGYSDPSIFIPITSLSSHPLK